MIIRVQALPVEEMRIIAERKIPENVRIISVVDPDCPFVFDETELDTIVQLKFDDIDPDWFQDEPLSESDSFVVFSEDNADTIVHTVKHWHAEKKDLILLVNCMAGVSRSAAIAEFVRRICNIDTDAFCKDNPIRYPNPHVLRTLMRVWMVEDGTLERWSKIPDCENDILFFCTKCGELLIGKEKETGLCEDCKE